MIVKAIERIPFVGPFWADTFDLLFGVADAMNLQRLQTAPPQPIPRDEKIVFLY